MDPKFADRMSDLGDITDEILEQRWSTLMGIVSNAGRHEQARIVLIACGAGLERDSDSWFWQPFRAHEQTIPVDEGAELFMRFAECAARYMIADQRLILPAMFVRLAGMAQLTPFHQDLVDAAVELLADKPSDLPEFSAPAAFWTTAVSKPLEESPADPAVGTAQLVAIASAAQRAISSIAKQVAAVTKWAAAAEDRFDHEQRLVHWLLNGVRRDGRPWSDLEPSTVAVDAAAELATLVPGAPQARHEATLAQVLDVAGKATSPISGAVPHLSATFAAPVDSALSALVPLTVSLAAADLLPEMAPAALAVRILWEITTIGRWEGR